MFVNKYITCLVFVFLWLFTPIAAQDFNYPEPLKVGVYDNPPKIFINKQGKADGIFVDLAKSIAKKEGLELEFVEGEWSDLLIMLQNGEIDVMPDMAFSNERDSLFNLSFPVLSSWIQVYTTDETVINRVTDLQDKTIGVLKASRQEEIMKTTVKLENGIDYGVITYNDYSSSVMALKSREIDAIVANRFFYFSELCDKDITATGVILEPSELYFGFNKAVDPRLIDIFNNNILELKNDPKSGYYRSLGKWFDKKEGALPKHIIWIMAATFSVLIILLVFVLMLRYQVKLKTKILTEKNGELLYAKQKAEESDKLKTVFLQNMSHEIRTPLNAILGFLDLLKDDELDIDSRNKYLNIVGRSGERLLNTINDIIEISKIESKQVHYQPATVNIHSLMEYFSDVFGQLAAQKGIKFKVTRQILEEQSLVESDKRLLEGVLANLLNNAIKFTNNGTIEFGNTIENGSLIFFVKDTGIGIPNDRIHAIFDRFVFADLKINRPYEGSGLGLSIVKAYVSLLGGKIRVDSEVGKGSTFFFSIPYKAKKI